jgi:hypothetical protein
MNTRNYDVEKTTAWWLTYPSEKYMSSSVEMMTFPIYGKIKNVPNHQPGIIQDN